MATVTVVATVATTQRKPAARKKPAAKKKQARPEHHVELWGVGLVVAGVLAALGTWFDLTGPFGRAVRDLTGGLVGVVRFVVPLLLVWMGALLVRGRPGVRGRIAAGLGLIVASVDGLMNLLRHTDAGSPARELRGAGGWVGVAVAQPLAAVLDRWGAALVLLVALVAGVLVLTRTTPKVAAAHVAAALLPVGRSIQRGWTRLTTVSEKPEAEAPTATDDDDPTESIAVQ